MYYAIIKIMEKEGNIKYDSIDDISMITDDEPS